MTIERYDFATRDEGAKRSPLVLGAIVPDESSGYWTEFFSGAIRMDYRVHETPLLGVRRDCELYVATTTDEGLELITKHNPALTVIDVCMESGNPHGTDGVDNVLMPARAQGYFRRVLCMGFADNGDQVYSRQHGADEFVEERFLEDESYGKSRFLSLAHYLLHHCPFAYASYKDDSHA